MQLRGGALFQLEHRGCLLGYDAAYVAGRVVEVAGQNRLRWANDHTSGLEATLDAMGTKVTFGGRVRGRIEIKRVVGARLHAGFAANTAGRVEVDDAIRAAEEGGGGTNSGAGGGVAVVTSHDAEGALGVRERALLDDLHPGAKDAKRHLVLFLARHRTGVAA